MIYPAGKLQEKQESSRSLQQCKPADGPAGPAIRGIFYCNLYKIPPVNLCNINKKAKSREIPKKVVDKQFQLVLSLRRDRESPNTTKHKNQNMEEQKMKEEILKKARLLEGYAEVIGLIESRIAWYQHTDDETGEVVDDEGEYSAAMLQALRDSMKAVKKLAGI